jgi:UDP-N-acetylmuramate--alanine ligase
VYDDYAHHPTAIAKTVEAAREKFPEKQIIVAFHPHTYSRTRSLMQDFGRALASADESIIAPIYAAREEADPAVTNAILADVTRRYGGNALALDSFDAIRDKLLSYDDRHLIITMGAGDIYKVAEQVAD